MLLLGYITLSFSMKG